MINDNTTQTLAIETMTYTVDYITKFLNSGTDISPMQRECLESAIKSNNEFIAKMREEIK